MQSNILRNVTRMYGSVRSLLTELIDYAGLFPPASLDFPTALSNFERYRAGEFGWMLGRFIVPAARLDELKGLAVPLSVLVGKNFDEDLRRIREFQRQQPGLIESIEVRADSVEAIRQISAKIPSDLPTFLEIPQGAGSTELMVALVEDGNYAKIRTGGITPEAFPSSEEVVRFLHLCATAGAAFKATAGLHHPVRGRYPLTDEPGSPSAWMHGFINLFLAAAFVRNHLPAALVHELIEEQSAAAFQFSDDGVRWRNHFLSSDEIAAVRDQFAASFGSCSVQEPIDGLKAIGLL
ncbi:MAG: hypothetical protein M3Z32_01580 [Acidobacteriota bacterium]|nr:hypothetical protein [Acidobacteriota bacterium]